MTDENCWYNCLSWGSNAGPQAREAETYNQSIRKQHVITLETTAVAYKAPQLKKSNRTKSRIKPQPLKEERENGRAYHHVMQ
jgi:hypothetical protein